MKGGKKAGPVESSQPIAAAGIPGLLPKLHSGVGKRRVFCCLDSFASQKSGSRVYPTGQEVV